MPRPRQGTDKEKALKSALSIVEHHSEGISQKDLYSEVMLKLSELEFSAAETSVYQWISQLDKEYPDRIEKPSRGLFVPTNSLDTSKEETASEGGDSFSAELNYYEGMSEFLVSGMNECTVAEPVGSMRINGKWGNPDVIGINKPVAGNVYRFQREIVTAELKTNPNEIPTAFGQAVSYLLFSHKVYVAVPRESTPTELAKLEAQCHLLGLGLIEFDLNIDRPNFDYRLRARIAQPDMYYVNLLAERIRKFNENTFEALFS